MEAANGVEIPYAASIVFRAPGIRPSGAPRCGTALRSSRATDEDEADLVAFDVDLNKGRLDQVGDILQMNGGGLVRTPKSLLFIQPGGFSGAFGVVREIHRASECSLQGLLRPID